jgi:hypothetical protein
VVSGGHDIVTIRNDSFEDEEVKYDGHDIFAKGRVLRLFSFPLKLQGISSFFCGAKGTITRDSSVFSKFYIARTQVPI